MHNKVGQGGSESEGESSKISGSTQENQGEQSASQGGKQKEAENQSNTETNKITTTKMESKTILETNENEIDWKIIKSEIEKVNSSWNVLVLDLSSMNVDNNDILNFSATLNDSILRQEFNYDKIDFNYSYKAVSIGNDMNTADNIIYTLKGTNLKPFKPLYLIIP